MSTPNDNIPSETTIATTSLARSTDASLERMRALQNRPLPTEQLVANTELVAMRTASREGSTRSILVFRVGAERFALDALAAHRVVPVSVVRRVPHRTNNVIAGVANIHGELTLVARIGAALGVAADSAQSHFVVMGTATARWAFAADSIEGVRRVDESALLAPPTTVRHAIDGCAAHLVELDVEVNVEMNEMSSGTRSPSAPSHNLVTILHSTKLAALFARSLT